MPQRMKKIRISDWGVVKVPSHLDDDAIQKMVDDQIVPELKATQVRMEKEFHDHERMRALNVSIQEEEKVNQEQALWGRTVDEAEKMDEESPHGFFETLKNAGYYDQEADKKDDWFWGFKPGRIAFGGTGPIQGGDGRTQQHRGDASMMRLGGSAAIVDAVFNNPTSFQEGTEFFARYGVNVLTDKYNELKDLRVDALDFEERKQQLYNEIRYIRDFNKAARVAVIDQSVEEAAKDVKDTLGMFLKSETWKAIAQEVYDDPLGVLAEMLIEINKDPAYLFPALGAAKSVGFAAGLASRRMVREAAESAKGAKILQEAEAKATERLLKKGREPTPENVLQQVGLDQQGFIKKTAVGGLGAAGTGLAVATPLELARQYDETGMINYEELLVTLGSITVASAALGTVAGSMQRTIARTASRVGVPAPVIEDALRETIEAATKQVPTGLKKTPEQALLEDTLSQAFKASKIKDPDLQAKMAAKDLIDGVKEPALLRQFEGPPVGQKLAIELPEAKVVRPPQWTTSADSVTPAPNESIESVVKKGVVKYPEGTAPISKARQKRVEKIFEPITSKGQDVDVGEHVAKAVGLADHVAKATGRNVVLTGAIEGHTRAQIKTLLDPIGIKVSSQVSRKTDALVEGTQKQVSNKLTKKQQTAHKYGTTVISGKEFKKLLDILSSAKDDALDEITKMVDTMFPGQQGFVDPKLLMGIASAGLAGLTAWKLSDEHDTDDRILMTAVGAAVALAAGGWAVPALARKLSRAKEKIPSDIRDPKFNKANKEILEESKEPPRVKDYAGRSEQIRNNLDNYGANLGLATFQGTKAANALRRTPGLRKVGARVRLTQTMSEVPQSKWKDVMTPDELHAAKTVQHHLEMLQALSKIEGHERLFLLTIMRAVFDPDAKQSALLMRHFLESKDVFTAINKAIQNPLLKSLLRDKRDIGVVISKAYESFYAARAADQLIQDFSTPTYKGLPALVMKSSKYNRLVKEGKVEANPDLQEYVTVDFPGLRGHRVHQSLVDPLNIYNGARHSSALFRGISALAYVAKRMTVSFSLFHANVLFDSVAYASNRANFMKLAVGGLGAGAGGAYLAGLAAEDSSAFTQIAARAAGFSAAAFFAKHLINRSVRKSMAHMIDETLSNPAMMQSAVGPSGGVQRYVRAGGKLNQLEDVRNEDFFRTINTVSSRLGMGKAGAVAEATLRKIDGYMWDNVLTHNKLNTFLVKSEELAKMNAKKGWGWSEAKIDRVAATFTNDAFGGLNWEQIAVGLLDSPTWGWLSRSLLTPKGRQVMQTLLFAPDWTISNLRIAFKGFTNADGAALYREYFARAMLYTVASGYVMYRTITGDEVSPQEYMEMKHQAAVEAMEDKEWEGKGSVEQSFAYAKETLKQYSTIDLGDGRKQHFNKQFTEVFKVLHDPVSYGLNKSTLFVKTPLEIAFNKEYFAGTTNFVNLQGPRLLDKDDSVPLKTAKITGQVLEKVLPIGGHSMIQGALSSKDASLKERAAQSLSFGVAGAFGNPIFGKERD